MEDTPIRPKPLMIPSIRALHALRFSSTVKLVNTKALIPRAQLSQHIFSRQ